MADAPVITPPAETVVPDPSKSQPAPWYGTPDSETLGYLQTKGWDKLPADKAALEVMKAHREAEKLIGVPQDQLIRKPAVGDVEGWNKVHTALGVPADPKAYDFSAIKAHDGQALSPVQVDTLQKMAHELRLDPQRAQLMVQKMAAISGEALKQNSTQNAGEHAAQLDTLKQNWTFKSETNKVIAQNAAAALGLDPTKLDTQGAPVVIPYAQAMEMFRSVGEKIGEDKFVRGGNGPNSPVMTVDQANYRLEQLGNDKLWYQRFQDGDTAARKEFDDLTRLIHASKHQG